MIHKLTKLAAAHDKKVEECKATMTPGKVCCVKRGGGAAGAAGGGGAAAAAGGGGGLAERPQHNGRHRLQESKAFSQNARNKTGVRDS